MKEANNTRTDAANRTNHQTNIMMTQQTQKIEEVGVFQRLDSKPRIWRGQMVIEVGDGSALAQMEPVLDVDVECEP